MCPVGFHVYKIQKLAKGIFDDRVTKVITFLTKKSKVITFSCQVLTGKGHEETYRGQEMFQTFGWWGVCVDRALEIHTLLYVIAKQ